MSLGGKSYLALASLFLVALATLVSSKAPISGTTELVHALEGLKEKLDAVALNKDASSDPSNTITLHELQRAAELYENCDPRLKLAIRQNWHLRLVLDFAVNPVRINSDMIDDPSMFDAFLLNLEYVYKRFRPAYEGKTIGDGKHRRIKSNSSRILFDFLLDPKSKITMKHFQRGRMEANNIRIRLEELTTSEDIYSQLEELEGIMNYFNIHLYKPLYDQIYPNLEKYQDAEEAREQYYKILWDEYGIDMKKGSGTQASEP